MVKTVLISIALIFLAVPLYCQDNQQSRSYDTLNGIVTSLDWVGSVMFVNEVRFSIPSTVRIYKGNSEIGLDEVNESDPVAVTYYDDPPGIHNAVTIVVQYSGDWAV